MEINRESDGLDANVIETKQIQTVGLSVAMNSEPVSRKDLFPSQPHIYELPEKEGSDCYAELCVSMKKAVIGAR